MQVEKYLKDISQIIQDCQLMALSSVSYDKRSEYLVFIRGDLRCFDQSLLHFREVVDLQSGIEKYTYAYHYQDRAGRLIFKYDNAEHYANLPNFPHHKHIGTLEIVPSEEMSLQAVLREVIAIVLQEKG